MHVRGTVAGEVEVRSVSTSYGDSDLAEVPVRLESDDGTDPTTVTLWNKWTESAELLDPGMEVLVTNAEADEYRGERQYTTTGDSYVVVEPSFLVNVTAIRNWVECPRLYYLNKLSGIPLNYPVVKGTIVHEVFGDLLRGRDLEAAIDDRVEERGLELGLLGETRESVAEDVRENAAAIESWLEQGRLTEEDSWRSEQLLISETFGIRGRADAIRRGAPVELKTGKNLKKEPRFKDKVQAACYALVLEEHGGEVDTGTLLYTKNSALDRNEETGDLTPAKDFSMGNGLLKFVVRLRNEIAAMEMQGEIPTGYEGDAKCEYCFEQDTCMVVSGRLDQESKAGAIGTPLPEAEREYFDRFYRAIEEERREVHREYAKLWEQDAQQRADDDRALIDLEFVEMRELEGGRWELRARREGGATSKLREGDLVLASDGDPVGGNSELARIERLDEQVVLTTDEPVEVTRLDVYPSELTTDRLLAALHDFLLKGDERRKDVLFGREKPAFDRPDETFVDNNDAQNEAVRMAVGAEDFALVHGPPGTGKTYTIARAVRAMVERGERVLLSAFTNRAVDNVLEALLEQLADIVDPDRIVRVGSESGVREDMQPYRLERSGEPADRVGKLQAAQVVAATTATCGSRVMKEQSFDVALVDEAAQLTEPGTYAAVNLADRFVLVGDHEQLPPVVRAENDLTESLFERLVDRHPEAGVMLDRQYRMNQRIQAFASQEFYDGRLRPAEPEVASRTLEDLAGVARTDLPEHLQDPVSFAPVEGDGSQYTDSEEAARIAELVEAYEEAGLERTDIGIIAPFRAQVSEISNHVPDAVTVDTVDRFQGSSQEVIVVSFTATGSLEGPIFEDHRRINVALTRPKRGLVLVGDPAALESDPVYRRMLEWARQ
ncbi:AAA domain-containing protein [Natronobacterium gregoryi]|uniref:DNA helicase n=2 Tax=Natronobacterium gregoryi TaxID=44930 RepID=L0AJA5_NATGS|nr:AAA domain-containing protein [Natronobacterium gregoryi]AFZ73252.1 DNA/RNA helicase, superfamily I [Natronobacterium gregoryi SP2]ELY71289.1 DNA replication factor Dna2 [Natronobacterium gregoryi SP2]PLK21659.1 Dna2/Cas4 domain-containing protein [Natronobacterium gregoryi SP2]SFI57446.1 DNA replication ATP-dependent helicase Dna2 [Natronobacterium gregoryi]